MPTMLPPWARVAWPVNPGAFRLFLALLVFVHHCSSLGLGKYAVYVFFVLSGYWVQRMWVGRYAHTHAPYLTYLVSRGWRLVPVFALAHLVTLPLLPLLGVPVARIASNSLPNLAFSSVFILGYGQLKFFPIGPAWSLDIEAQYYLIAPLMTVLAWQLRTRFNLLMLLVAAALIALTSALLIQHPVLPSYLFFFASGLVAAQLRWRPSGTTAAIGVGAVIAILILVTLSPFRGILLGAAHPGPLFVWNPQLNIVCAVLTIPFAIYTTHQESDATDRMMADLSYIVYLFHWLAVRWLFTVHGGFLVMLGYKALAGALVLPVSWLIWRFYDRPINAARARWVASRIPASPAAVAHEVPGP